MKGIAVTGIVTDNRGVSDGWITRDGAFFMMVPPCSINRGLSGGGDLFAAI